MAVIKKSHAESGESVSVNESRMESKLLRFTTLLLMPIRMWILRTMPSIHWQVGRMGFGHAEVDAKAEETEEAVATMATCICTKILRDSAIRTQLLFDVARVRLLSAPQFPWQASKCWSKRDRARCEGEAERPVIRGKGKKNKKKHRRARRRSCCRQLLLSLSLLSVSQVQLAIRNFALQQQQEKRQTCVPYIQAFHIYTVPAESVFVFVSATCAGL